MSALQQLTPDRQYASSGGDLKRMAGLAAAFTATIVAANVATAAFGQLEVGPLAVTWGTFGIGLSFVARDALHEVARWRRVIVGAIVAGAVLSGLLTLTLTHHVDPTRLALASGAAILGAELADMQVFTALRQRSRGLAWLVSNIIAAPIDSIGFLWIAGFPVGDWPGQTAMKIAVGVLVPLLLAGAVWLYRRKEGFCAVLRHCLHRSGA